jgi:hypothetical protein
MAKRQAVLLIHGIGEQKPMDTLRGFVDAVWRDHTEIHHPFATKHAGALVFSKPDTVSDSFELRRLTTPQNVAGIRTDFFEFYWQHLMEGTTYGHVAGWAWTLLFRRPGKVPPQLRLAYWLLWLLLIVAVLLAGYTGAAAAKQDAPLVPWWLSALASVVLVPVVGGIIKGTVGDAARYLDPAPANVQQRHAIRQAGIKVLSALHERQKYDRIIVVGHSLGTVIGYDVLTHSWPSLSQWKLPDAPSMTHLDALEGLAAKPDTPADVMHRAQRAYFDEAVANGCTWRVTDFVTLGSPLAHAAILLARDRADLETKQDARELPKSPPVLEHATEDHAPVARFSFAAGRRGPAAFRVPHHAAVFGPTRWTNLYFPNRLIVVGDLIGGPLADIFGRGVRDVDVTTTLRRGRFSHTLYWKQTPDGRTAPHIAALRRALDLLDNGGVVPPAAARR